MNDLHETHVCRDCGAEITMPYATPPSEEATVLYSAAELRDRIEEAVTQHFAIGRHGMSLHACGTAVAIDILGLPPTEGTL